MIHSVLAFLQLVICIWDQEIGLGSWWRGGPSTTHPRTSSRAIATVTPILVITETRCMCHPRPLQICLPAGCDLGAEVQASTAYAASRDEVSGNGALAPGPSAAKG